MNVDIFPPALLDVHWHATDVCRGEAFDEARLARLRQTYGAERVVELALCIAGARIYPALKRGLGRAQHCERVQLNF